MTSRVRLVSNRAPRRSSEPVTRSVDALCNVAVHPFSPFRFVFVGCKRSSYRARKIPKYADVLHWKCRSGTGPSYKTQNTGTARHFPERRLFVYKFLVKMQVRMTLRPPQWPNSPYLLQKCVPMPRAIYDL